MAGRTDTDYGLVPVESRVSLSSRPVPPSYNKGRESNLTKQKNSKQSSSFLFFVFSFFENPWSSKDSKDFKDFLLSV